MSPGTWTSTTSPGSLRFGAKLADHEDPLYHYDWLDWITFRDPILGNEWRLTPS